jgi:hypothetical protein
MKLNCTINQAEAIRRGFDTTQTVTLEVDPSTMSPEDRDVLASRFKAGNNYKESYPAFPANLNEPTLEGLMENIRAVREDAANKKVAKEKQELEDIAKAQEQFASRQGVCYNRYITVKYDGSVDVSQYSLHNSNSCRYIETKSECRGQSDTYKTEWKRLLTTPEGAAWIEQLDSDNAAAREIAEHEAHAASIKAQRLIAEQKAEEQALRHWSLANGSETLRLRTEENLDWQDLAREEWADDAIRRAGIDTPVPILEGYECEEIPVTEPTAQQIRALRRIRDAIAKIPEANATVKLVAYRYTEENDDYHTEEPKVITRKEIAVYICGMHCNSSHFFIAK